MASKRSEAKGAVPAKTGGLWWPYVVAGLLGLFLVYEAYSPSSNGAFVFDDRALPFLQSWYGNASFQSAVIGSRPLLNLTYLLNYKAGALEPGGYHAVNILFHFLSALFLGFCLRRVLSFAGVSESLARILTLFGAGVFLLHPAQTESVAYVASRSENLSAFTYYAAFAVFLWTLPNAISWLRAIGILVLFALASLTKEHTMSLPVILLLTDLWWNPGFAGTGISVEGIKRNWRLYAMILAGAALGAVGVIRTIRTADTVGFGLKDLTPLEYFYSQGRSIWEYVRLFVLPAGLNIDRDFPVSRGPLDHGALFGWIAIVAVTVAAWMYRRRFPLAAYGWLAFLIMLAPTSSIIPIRDLIAERRLYLPMFGLLLIACEFLRRTTLKTATLVPALSAILLVFAFLTYQRSQVWASSVALWKDTVEKSPNKARPRFQYAFALYEEGQCEQASSQFEATSKLQPLTYDLAIDWALALDCSNRPGDALVKLQQAAQLEPKAHVYSLMGMIHAKQGRREEAMAALDQAQKLDPRFAMSYVYRGNVYEVSSQPDLAAAEYRKALEIDPNLDAARQALARVAR